MRRSNMLPAACLTLLSLPLRADAGDPFGQADVVSAIGLSRLADEAGDARLAVWLKTQNRRDLTLAAVRAAPFAAAPERLLPLLAPVLCGRDPVLAPETAIALTQIAGRLSPADLAAREVLLSELGEARAALACGRDAEPALRADLQAAALLLEAALSQPSQ